VAKITASLGGTKVAGTKAAPKPKAALTKATPTKVAVKRRWTYRRVGRCFVTESFVLAAWSELSGGDSGIDVGG
jgi:hypothetical protein